MPQLNKIFRGTADLIYGILPRFHYAVIWGWPDYEDSVIALEQALQDSSLNRVILLMTDPSLTPNWKLGAKTRRVRKNSIPGILLFGFAKFVFFTHPCFTRNYPKNVISVNVWHGMPIKKIGWMIEDDRGISSRYTLATSSFWEGIMERAMKPSGEVIPVGLPRNDRLFCNKDNVTQKLGLDENIKIGAWLPTYRKSVRGHARCDGVPVANPFEMTDIDLEQLSSFLKSENIILFVKPHPMAEFDSSQSTSNLIIIDNTWLSQKALSLYEFLGATDFLVSDVSSVLIDYLLLDKPIIHAFADFKEYEKNRGFTLKEITDYQVGPIVSNSVELEEAVSEVILGKDPYTEMRNRIKHLSHSNSDNQATKRLLDVIGI